MNSLGTFKNRPTQLLAAILKMAGLGLLLGFLFAVPATARPPVDTTRGAALADDIKTLYAKYFADGDIDKIMLLYDLRGADQQTIDDIKSATTANFSKTIKEIRLSEVYGGKKRYFVKGGDGLPGMAPNLTPYKQMLVDFRTNSKKLDSRSQMPLNYTLIGRDEKSGRYYLAAYVRSNGKH